MRVAVYDLTGRRVTTLLDGERDAGANQVRWPGLTDDGRTLPAGVYHARLEFGGASVTRRLVLTR